MSDAGAGALRGRARVAAAVAVSTAPIVALTANADPWDAAEYLEAGMDAVVEKPIRPDALLAAMTGALERRAGMAGKAVSGAA